jgi:hypothetical protein
MRIKIIKALFGLQWIERDWRRLNLLLFKFEYEGFNPPQSLLKGTGPKDLLD